MGRHRQEVRPRYGRIAVLSASVSVTAIAVLGGTGLLPTSAHQAASAASPSGAIDPVSSEQRPGNEAEAGTTSRSTPDSTDGRLDPSADTTLPRDSGTGRRVVFSQSRQRVWQVPAGRRVARTYPVSGSLYDNLDPGTYEVYSRSERAWGIDDSGTMKYFVRFAHGDSAAIGFHDIPIDDGEPVQSVEQLGAPLSHGCIRQKRSDAIALWRFAPLGTTVVVTE